MWIFLFIVFFIVIAIWMVKSDPMTDLGGIIVGGGLLAALGVVLVQAFAH